MAKKLDLAVGLMGLAPTAGPPRDEKHGRHGPSVLVFCCRQGTDGAGGGGRKEGKRKRKAKPEERIANWTEEGEPIVIG